MRSAVFVSFTRTPVGRACCGAFNDTQSQAPGGHAIAHPVHPADIERAGGHGLDAASLWELA